MKRDWLLYLVIFSLALNLGIIGTLIYWRSQWKGEVVSREGPPPLHLRDLWGQLHLEPEQRQTLRRCLADHHRQLAGLRRQLAQKRQELLELIKQPSPEWVLLQGKIREIAATQGQLEEELVRLVFEVQKNLTPEQRAEFVRVLEQRVHKGLRKGRWGAHFDDFPREPGGGGRRACPPPGPGGDP